jgi:hypothetical protein
LQAVCSGRFFSYLASTLKTRTFCGEGDPENKE